MEIVLLSLITALLAVLLGFVIRGSFVIGERLGRLEEGQEEVKRRLGRLEAGQERINKEIEEVRIELKLLKKQ